MGIGGGEIGGFPAPHPFIFYISASEFDLMVVENWPPLVGGARPPPLRLGGKGAPPRVLTLSPAPFLLGFELPPRRVRPWPGFGVVFWLGRWELLFKKLFKNFLQCGNVCFGVARRRYAFSHHVADGHFVVNIEALRDNVLAVELVANDAGANGVAVKADEQVEKCSAVADFDVSRAVEIDGGERFFGKVERVEIALFVGQVRERF